MRVLPRERLPVVAYRLAVECPDAKEMELDVRMRIDEFLHEPGRRAAHDDAELLAELAHQRLLGRLVRFELAARKFPVTGVGLAGRSLREQDVPVAALDDRCGDANDGAQVGRMRTAALTPFRA